MPARITSQPGSISGSRVDKIIWANRVLGPDCNSLLWKPVRGPLRADAVSRFHRALVQIDGVSNEFRTGFLGKVSPVHLFWGSFDLATTRFSGRFAPVHPGGIPNHEVSSAGFWPGGGDTKEPCFYSYAYPTPDGFSERPVIVDDWPGRCATHRRVNSVRDRSSGM